MARHASKNRSFVSTSAKVALTGAILGAAAGALLGKELASGNVRCR